MSKFKIVNLIDKIFITIAVFLIIYAWINFYIRSLWVTFALSLTFSFAIIFVLYYFLDKKTEKKALSKSKNDEINKNFFNFKLNSTSYKYKLMKQILSKEYETKLLLNKLTYVKEDKTHLVIINTNIDNFTQNDLYNTLEEYTNSKINVFDIVCNNYAFNINTKIFKNKEINLINKQKLYDEYFLKYNIFPDGANIENSVNKVRFKDILKGMFLPNKARGYFFCGLILIFSAIILPYHYYYLIFGSVLLFFAILCKILPKINAK